MRVLIQWFMMSLFSLGLCQCQLDSSGCEAGKACQSTPSDCKEFECLQLASEFRWQQTQAREFDIILKSQNEGLIEKRPLAIYRSKSDSAAVSELSLIFTGLSDKNGRVSLHLQVPPLTGRLWMKFLDDEESSPIRLNLGASQLSVEVTP